MTCELSTLPTNSGTNNLRLTHSSNCLNDQFCSTLILLSLFSLLFIPSIPFHFQAPISNGFHCYLQKTPSPLFPFHHISFNFFHQQCICSSFSPEIHGHFHTNVIRSFIHYPHFIYHPTLLVMHAYKLRACIHHAH